MVAQTPDLDIQPLPLAGSGESSTHPDGGSKLPAASFRRTGTSADTAASLVDGQPSGAEHSKVAAHDPGAWQTI
jgi:hypothetical protein